MFVPQAHASDLGKYFMENEGYKFAREIIPPGLSPGALALLGAPPGVISGRSVEETTMYLKYTAKENRTQKIRVIYTYKALVLCLLKGIKTTGVMNIMTLNKAVFSGEKVNDLSDLDQKIPRERLVDFEPIDTFNEIFGIHLTSFRAVVAELLRLIPDQLPEDADLPSFDHMMGLNDDISDVMRRVPKPKTWKYANNLIPHWSVDWAAKLAANRERVALFIATGQIGVPIMRVGGIDRRCHSEDVYRTFEFVLLTIRDRRLSSPDLLDAEQQQMMSSVHHPAASLFA
ncbi:hypothetical protein VTL71DRAFT_10694 [Oculimacula yallundae]|uniref:Uncharacterized protein n=1 Tax=Oculimacula yallundae TaxID=86028 RepID=A0ABR4CTT5_9HELO